MQENASFGFTRSLNPILATRFCYWFEDAPGRVSLIEIKDTHSRLLVDRRKVLLGGATFVAVVQAADLRNCDDLAERLNRTWIRRILVQ